MSDDAAFWLNCARASRLVLARITEDIDAEEITIREIDGEVDREEVWRDIAGMLVQFAADGWKRGFGGEEGAAKVMAEGIAYFLGGSREASSWSVR